MHKFRRLDFRIVYISELLRCKAQFERFNLHLTDIDEKSSKLKL